MSMWPEHLSRIILHQLTLECVGTVSKLVKSAPHCIFNFFGSLDFLPAARAVQRGVDEEGLVSCSTIQSTAAAIG